MINQFGLDKNGPESTKKTKFSDGENQKSNVPKTLMEQATKVFINNMHLFWNKIGNESLLLTFNQGQKNLEADDIAEEFYWKAKQIVERMESDENLKFIHDYLKQLKALFEKDETVLEKSLILQKLIETEIKPKISEYGEQTSENLRASIQNYLDTLESIIKRPLAYLSLDYASPLMRHAFSIEPEQFSCSAILPNGSIVAGTYQGNVYIKGLDDVEFKLLSKEKHTSWISCIAVLSNGDIVTGSNDFTARIWSSVNGECKNILAGHSASIDM